VPDRDRRFHPEPIVDVSAALGEAGHEVEDLGFADIPDNGPVTVEPGAPQGDVDDAADIAAVEFPAD
jgi:hypothetical protein